MQAPALLVIDILQDFTRSIDPAEKDSLICSTNALATIVRNSGGSVFWIRQEFAADLSDAFLEMRRKSIAITIAGTQGCQFDLGLDVRCTDQHVVKKRYSAFFGTELDRQLGPPSDVPLIVAGLNTHACVRMTAIDAYQRDWNVILAKDCLHSYDHEHHDVSLRYMDGKIAELCSNAEIEGRLGAHSS